MESQDREQALQGAERAAVLGFFLFILTATLVGNTFILASIYHRALTLNRLLVIAMQHIAVSDILKTMSQVVPTLVSLVADGWVLGQGIGYILYYLGTFGNNVGNGLLGLLCCLKLVILVAPSQSRRWGAQVAHWWCGAMWAISLVLPILVAAERPKLYFTHVYYFVHAEVLDWFHGENMDLRTILVFLTVGVPALAVLLSVPPTLGFLIKSLLASRRVGGETRWQAMTAVLLMAILHTSVTIPSFFALHHVVKSGGQVATLSITPMVRIGTFVGNVNIVVNFFVYYLTISSFRNFVNSKIWTLMMELRERVKPAVVHTEGDSSFGRPVVSPSSAIAVTDNLCPFGGVYLGPQAATDLS